MTGKTSNVKTAADLNGQIVAVNGLRDLTPIRDAGVDRPKRRRREIRKLIEIPFSEMGAALAADRVAAAIFAEPFLDRGALADAPSSATLRGVGNDYMVTVLVRNHRSGWRKNADTAKRLQTPSCCRSRGGPTPTMPKPKRSC